MIADAELVRASWDRLEPVAGRVAARFYARLFVECPQLRDLFPALLEEQQDHFVQALRRVVRGLDSPELLERYLTQLGQDHRKFAVAPEHYLPFGRALITTLRLEAPDWDDRTEEAWITAYATAAQQMMAGASGAADAPAWWDAVVVGHERPALDLAVLTLRPDRPYGFYPGQYLTLETAQRPRLWRPYSIANAPRSDGTLELHVRAVPGGWVSGALVRRTGVGERVRLGPPLGGMQVDPDSQRDLLFVAGGTGLAPCKAMIEHVARWNTRRRVHLFVGARRPEELYGLAPMRRLATGLPWLHVVGAVSEDAGYLGRHGAVCDVAVGAGDWSGHDVYVSGPPGMVRAAVSTLRRHGVPLDRVQYDPVSTPD